MTILVKREVWRKPHLVAPEQASTLTAEEVENARRAIRFLRTRLGGGPKLAAALRVKLQVVEKACGGLRRPSVELVLRAARLAGVPLEDVLSGSWPPAGMCPFCGNRPVP